MHDPELAVMSLPVLLESAPDAAVRLHADQVPAVAKERRDEAGGCAVAGPGLKYHSTPAQVAADDGMGSRLDAAVRCDNRK